MVFYEEVLEDLVTKGETGFEKEAERLEDIKEQVIFTYESL